MAGRLFAIGDLQGCYDEFRRLLDAVAFDSDKDRLWLTGDLINRGPNSLDTLRFCYQLRHVTTVVLGNHDLHFLAVALGGHKFKKKDTLHALFEAPDLPELLNWLRNIPLMHFDPVRNAALVHAGILPGWTIETALALAEEVEAVLKGPDIADFLKVMYGNQPDQWSPKLKGHDRLRVITNVFTRMRFLSASGQLDMSNKGPVSSAPKGFRPWYEFARPDDSRIFFGHWAALMGETGKARFQALDTGCVWGQRLRAVEVDTGSTTEVVANPAANSRV